MSVATSVKDYTKKKTTYYQERQEKDRTLFQEQLKKIDPKKVVYIDEAGIDNRLYREYARALRGQKVYAPVPGKKRERISIIGGLMEGVFVAPFTFKGGCNKEVFNTWLEQILLPQVPKGTTFIMDNATFHKSPQTRELIEKAGCYLLFLPTYSPDLNPIEHWWHKIKSILRPLIQQPYANLQDLIGDSLLNI